MSYLISYLITGQVEPRPAASTLLMSTSTGRTRTLRRRRRRRRRRMGAAKERRRRRRGRSIKVTSVTQYRKMFRVGADAPLMNSEVEL